jgi:prophage regulatory protein
MPEPERILRMRTVLERTGLSRSTLYRKMRDGTFPKQVRISEHCCGWRESANQSLDRGSRRVRWAGERV